MIPRIVLSFAAVICCSLTLFAQQDRTLPDSTAITTRQLQQSTADWVKAYNSNDLEKLAGFYAKDADYVSPHVSGLTLHGREQIRENFARGIAGGGHLDSVVVERSGFSCDFAYLVCSYHAINSGVTVHGKNVLVMKGMPSAQ